MLFWGLRCHRFNGKTASIVSGVAPFWGFNPVGEVAFETPPKLNEKTLQDMKMSRWFFDGDRDFADLGTVTVADVVSFAVYYRFSSDPKQALDAQIFEFKDTNGNLISVYKNGDQGGAKPGLVGRLTLNVQRPGQKQVKR